MTRIAALLALVLLCFVPLPVLSYVRECKWNMQGDITIDINKDGFEERGIDPVWVQHQTALAANELYVRAGLPYRLLVNSAFVTDTVPTTGRILVRGIPTGGASTESETITSCGSGFIAIYTGTHSFSAGFGQGASEDDRSLQVTMLHELGHVLGLGHSTAAYSVMNASPSGTFELTHDDITGLRSGTCTYGSTVCANCACVSGTCGTAGAVYDCGYGHRATSYLTSLASTNDTTSWAENVTNVFVNITRAGASQPSNLEVSHEFGTAGPYGKYLAAFVKSGTDDEIHTAIGSGASWSVLSLGEKSQSGPSVAFGNGVWIIVWVGRSASQSAQRPIYYRTGTIDSSSVATWNSTQQLSYEIESPPGTIITVYPDSLSRPSVAYAPALNKFVLAWSDRPTGRIRSVRGDAASSITWASISEQGGMSLNGVALACVAGSGSVPTYDDCLLAWPFNQGQNLINSSRAWTDPNPAYYLNANPSRATAEYTRDPMDVAIRRIDNNSNLKVVMAFKGFTSPYKWYFAVKNTTSQMTNWPTATDPAGPGSGLVSAPSIAYSPSWSEWTSIYSR